MAKEWRPDNWENPYPEYPDLSCQRQTVEWLRYEAGADAMLSSICKLTDGTHMMLKLFRDSNGKVNIVKYPQEFIPDEAPLQEKEE